LLDELLVFLFVLDDDVELLLVLDEPELEVVPFDVLPVPEPMLGSPVEVEGFVLARGDADADVLPGFVLALGKAELLGDDEAFFFPSTYSSRPLALGFAVALGSEIATLSEKL